MFAYIMLISRKNAKMKTHISRIKKFDAKNHSPYQKYNIVCPLDNGDMKVESGVILHLTDTEQELVPLIEVQRPKYPPARILVSCDETTDEESPLRRKVPLGAKRKVDEHSVAETALRKRLSNTKNVSAKDLLSKKPESQDISTGGRIPLKNIENERTLSLTKDSSLEVQELKNNLEKVQQEFKKVSELYTLAKQQLVFLEKEQTNSKVLYETLQQDLLMKENEVNTLRRLNGEWQKTGIKNCIEGTETRGNVQRTGTTDDGEFLPVGFVDKKINKIHLGRNVWLPMEAYTLAVCSVPKKRIQTFPKNILVALCGYQKLSDTTVTGKGSNRNKQTRQRSEKLDPKIALAIKDIYTYWLIHEKGFDRQKAEIEVDGSYKKLLAKKIAQVKQTKCMSYERDKQKRMMGDLDRTTANNDHNDEDAQKDNTEEERVEEKFDDEEVNYNKHAKNKEILNAEHSEYPQLNEEQTFMNINRSLEELESGVFPSDSVEYADDKQTSNAEHSQHPELNEEQTFLNMNEPLQELERSEFSDIED